MSNCYTLEEWLGMLEEAGYSLEEATRGYEADRGWLDTMDGTGKSHPDKIDWTARAKSYKPQRSPHSVQLGIDGEEEFSDPHDSYLHNPSTKNQTSVPKPTLAPDLDTTDTDDLVSTDRLSVGKNRTSKINDPKWKQMVTRLRQMHPSPKLEEGNKANNLSENTVARLQSLAGIKPTK